MMYPLPQLATNSVLIEALNIAMDYLMLTGQADDYTNVQYRVVAAIIAAYRRGATHRIALANKAIVTIEQPKPPSKMPSFYPRVG